MYMELYGNAYGYADQHPQCSPCSSTKNTTVEVAAQAISVPCATKSAVIIPMHDRGPDCRCCSAKQIADGRMAADMMTAVLPPQRPV